MKFNKNQQQAIEFYKGSCATVAGAGSGKTAVLINRIKNLVDTHNVDEKEILTISFTRKTADELKAKLNKMGYRNVNVGTFHSVCGRILSNEGYELGRNLIKEWEVKNCLKSVDSECNDKEIISYISYQKCFLRYPDDEFVYKETNYTEDELRLFYKQYEAFKSKNNKYDFDDYLIKCYELLTKLKNKYTYDFVLVDEHQDSNLVQNLLLKELCPSGNMFCVFDAKQAIYSFRGGSTEHCINFTKEWDNASVINLDINYRSTKNIVEKANDFIRPYYSFYEHYSDAIPHNESDGIITIESYADRESEGIEVVDHIEKLLKDGENPNEIAVLYRVNSHSGNVENELRHRGIDYEITNDSSFFKRKEIKGIISYLRLINNPHDDDAFETIYRLGTQPLKFFSNNILNDIRRLSGIENKSFYETFISMRHDKPWQNTNAKNFETAISRLMLQKSKNVDLTTLIDNIIKTFQVKEFIRDSNTDPEEVKDRLESLETLKSFIKGNSLESFIDYVYMSETKKKPKDKCVKLMSIHSSKGLEFKHTYLIGVEDGKFPHEKSDVMEEARLFYVAVTRSKENLYISEIGKGNQFIKEYEG